MENKKIMICGSMSFAKEMLALQNQLKAFGYEVSVPCDTELHVEKPGFIDELDKDREHLIKNNIMKKCFGILAGSDSILFLNLPKNGVNGYIGTSSLMEMGLAYYLGKKIFLMYPYPDPNVYRWAHEVASFEPTVLNGSIDFFQKTKVN
ncbi:MAG: hypothetical protein ACM3NH_03245 [Candidatus Saccharibacteria bacterium]